MTPAEIAASFDLAAGESLDVLVGAGSTRRGGSHDTGGAGGTFVAKSFGPRNQVFINPLALWLVECPPPPLPILAFYSILSVANKEFLVPTIVKCFAAIKMV